LLSRAAALDPINLWLMARERSIPDGQAGTLRKSPDETSPPARRGWQAILDYPSIAR